MKTICFISVFIVNRAIELNEWRWSVLCFCYILVAGWALTAAKSTTMHSTMSSYLINIRYNCSRILWENFSWNVIAINEFALVNSWVIGIVRNFQYRKTQTFSATDFMQNCWQNYGVPILRVGLYDYWWAADFYFQAEPLRMDAMSGRKQVFFWLKMKANRKINSSCSRTILKHYHQWCRPKVQGSCNHRQLTFTV